MKYTVSFSRFRGLNVKMNEWCLTLFMVNYKRPSTDNEHSLLRKIARHKSGERRTKYYFLNRKCSSHEKPSNDVEKSFARPERISSSETGSYVQILHNPDIIHGVFSTYCKLYNLIILIEYIFIVLLLF